MHAPSRIEVRVVRHGVVCRNEAISLDDLRAELPVPG
jgi:hypothetical protein